MIYGKTNQEQTIEKLAWREKYYHTWHKWFAWYPIQLRNGRKVWWQTIYRKRYNPINRSNWYWEYKLKGGD